MSAVEAEPPPPLLPAAVRARATGLACQGLSRMPTPQVPPALRRSATFAPAKRVKLVGGQVLAALETDDDFREHVGTQVRALVPDIVTGLETQAPVDDEQLVDAAAVAYLLRTPGWEDLLGRAGAQSSARSAPDRQLHATIERLTGALDQARGENKALRERTRKQLDDVKSDNTALRRSLGQVRTQLKEAELRAAEALASYEQLQRDSAVAARASEAEIRRWRARVTELEGEHTSARRAARDDRDAETMRLRLLLDTVADAAAGLRRELALPAAGLLPADTVVALEPAQESSVGATGKALRNDDPALLRRLLELPRAHLIIDGYNVSITAWPTAPLSQQRARLMRGVGALVAGKAVETTIVFDGADLVAPPSASPPRGVRIRFSPPGVIADDLIRQLVEAEPVGRPVIVVSTDREVATSVTKKGARAVDSLALIRAMGL